MTQTETESASKSLPLNAYQPLKPGESYTPIIPPGMHQPEITMRSVLWGIFFCVIFTVASAYSTLKVGQGMEAAIPISILAIGLARMYSRRSTLLENVIIIGMGGASAAVVAGAVFTLARALHSAPEPASGRDRLHLPGRRLPGRAVCHSPAPLLRARNAWAVSVS